MSCACLVTVQYSLHAAAHHRIPTH
jgi:hypothetical protein